MTQITRKSVPMRGLILLLAMFLGAGLVLSGCGDEATTTPAPAPPPPPPPPAPEPEPEPEPEPQAPATPTGFHADVTDTSITWHWNAVEGAIAYAVQVSEDEMFDATDTITPTVEPSFMVSPLPPGTSLYGRVAAAGGTPEAPILSDWTTHVTGTTTTPAAPVPPAAPSGLAATGSGMDYIEWTWTAVDGATGYYVQYSTDEMFTGAEDPMMVEGTSYRRDGLDEGMTAYLRVAATDGTLMSDWSMHATGMTMMADAPVPPAAPMGLSVSGTGADYIEWSWEAVDGATGYHVQFSTDESMLMDAEPMAVDGTSHRQMGLDEGSTGYLRVRAVADDLAGMWTAHLTAMTQTTPTMPMNVMATATGDSITWTWDEVDGADGYQIQYSADGVFTGSTKTMPAEGNSYMRDGLSTGTSAFLRVRSTSGGTGIEAMLISGWTMPTKGTTMTPQPPAIPTGLMAESGAGSITLTWDEVEGATSYEVQFSTDPGFGDAKTEMVEEGTSYTMPDLGYSVRGYLRVRAVNDAGKSAWAPTATATTMAAPAAELPALMVSFAIPEGEYPMVPDGDTDKEKAKASVNTKIEVTSSVAAVITPMFEPDANGQNLAADDGNMPFAFVSWSALQSAVVSEAGVTFQITRAGTTGENEGDMVYVTCGPFQCTESSAMQAMAQDIGIADVAACTNWNPTFELKVGKVDNAADTDTEENVTGIDLGWSYTSNGTGFTATHDIAVTSDKSGLVKATSTAKSLMVPHVGEGILGTMLDQDGDGDLTEEGDRLRPCETNDGDSPSYTKTIGTVQDPGSCFRVKLDKDNDYLSNYTVSLDSGLFPKWGAYEWKTQKCPTRPYEASTMVDVCDLFEDEVDRLAKPEIVPMFEGTGNDAQLDGFDLKFGTAKHYRFTSLWYMQSTEDDASRDPNDVDSDDTLIGNLVDIYAGDTDSAIGAGIVSQDADVDWINVLDKDGDPKAEFGDLGMIDRNGNDVPDNWSADTGADPPPEEVTLAEDAEDVACSDSDGGSKVTKDKLDGTLCDAKKEFMVEVTFTDGIGQCENNVTREFTVTCNWDADGGAVVASDGTTRSPSPSFDETVAADDDNNFLTCKIE